MADIKDLYDYYYKDLKKKKFADLHGYNLKLNKDFIIWLSVFLATILVFILLLALSVKMLSFILMVIIVLLWVVFLICIPYFKKGSSDTLKIIVNKEGERLIWTNVKFEELKKYTFSKMEKEGKKQEEYYSLMIEQCRDHCDGRGFSIERYIAYIALLLSFLAIFLNGNNNISLNLLAIGAIGVVSVGILLIMMLANFGIDLKYNRYRALLHILQRMR